MYEISKFVILIRVRKKHYNIYIYIFWKKKKKRYQDIYMNIFYNQTISEKIAMLKFIGMWELENNQQIIRKS